MRIEPLIPDAAPPASIPFAPAGAQSTFGHLLDDMGAVFTGASRAEDRFAAGTGDLQTAVYERAKADVALSVASAAAQRAVQSLQTILNMQV